MVVSSHSPSIPVLISPLPGQLTRNSCCQNGLAEALNGFGGVVELLLAGFNGSKGGVELVGDAALLVEGRNGNRFLQLVFVGSILILLTPFASLYQFFVL